MIKVKCGNPVCNTVAEISKGARRCCYCGAPYGEYGVNLDTIRTYYQLDSDFAEKREDYYLKHYPLRGFASFMFLFFPGIFVQAMLLNTDYRLYGLLVLVISIAAAIYLILKNVEWVENNARDKFPRPKHPQGINP